jgi:cytochrome c oxidase subunit 1
MGWFRMPLFLWGLYATAIIQVLATPVLGITLLLLIAERILTSASSTRPGRRPGALPALLLVLLPPGGLHHDPAGHGHHLRADLGVQPQAHLRLPFIAFSSHGHRPASASWCGATTCSLSGQGDLANMIFSALTFSVAIPSAVKVFNWLATMYKGSSPGHAHALRAGFMFLFAIGG